MPDLWPHQVTAADEAFSRFMCNKGGAVIEARMGGGKTRAAIHAVIGAGSKRVIIVAPKTVAADVWPRELGGDGRARLPVMTLVQWHWRQACGNAPNACASWIRWLMLSSIMKGYSSTSSLTN